ncbi:hypothetical protein YC2023_055250 [Brassica napus]
MDGKQYPKGKSCSSNRNCKQSDAFLILGSSLMAMVYFSSLSEQLVKLVQ